MRRRWVNFGSRARVTTLIPQADGTAIGGMTAGGNLAASFDGNKSQAAGAASQNSGITAGYAEANSIGKEYATAKAVTRIKAWAPNDNGFRGDTPASLGWKFYTHTSNVFGSATERQSGTVSGAIAATLDVTITVPVSAECWWLVFEGNGANATRNAEAEAYEDI